MEKAGRPPGFFFWEARPGQPNLPGNGGCEQASSRLQYPPPASPFAKVTTICEREFLHQPDLPVQTALPALFPDGAVPGRGNNVWS